MTLGRRKAFFLAFFFFGGVHEGAALLLQCTDVFVATEGETGSHADPRDAEEKEGRTGTFSCAEKGGEQAIGALRGHQRLKHAVDKKTAQRVADWYGEKLEGVARSKNAALQFERDAAAHDYVKIGIHDGDEQPAEHRADAPYGRGRAKGKEEIFCAHGNEQRVADDPDTAFRRGKT